MEWFKSVTAWVRWHVVGIGGIGSVVSVVGALLCYLLVVLSSDFGGCVACAHVERLDVHC